MSAWTLALCALSLWVPPEDFKARAADGARLAQAEPEVRQAHAELQDVCRRLAAAPAEQAWQSLAGRRERLEVALAGKLGEVEVPRLASARTPAELQRMLPENCALVDYLVYGLEPADVVAFVLTRRDMARVNLGPLAPVEAALTGFLGSLHRRVPVQGAADPAATLRDRLWLPLEKHLGGAKTVLISPDGPLWRIPFAALPSADGKRYLIEDYALAVLPARRLLELLAERGKGKERPPSLLAVGDVDFDAAGAPAVAVEAAGKRQRTGEALRWGPLPGTRAEVLALQDTFNAAVKGGRLTVLRGKNASEAAVRSEAPRHEYLHLATHGIFAPPERKSALRPGDKVGHHPGLLSGLVLAGANHPRGEDDGVLTALEVEGMDLSKVELAVLSAGETGLGVVAGREGVLGLQRAFQLAGARTTITSLWKVDDDATCKLMDRFYINYWKKGMGTLEALREAQRWMLREGPARGVPGPGEPALLPAGVEPRSPPRYWAAFVLSGDWR